MNDVFEEEKMQFALWYLSGVATPFIVVFLIRFFSWAVDRDSGWECEIPKCDAKMGGDNDVERYNIESWLRYQYHEYVTVKAPWHVKAAEKFSRRKEMSEYQNNLT